VPLLQDDQRHRARFEAAGLRVPADSVFIGNALGAVAVYDFTDDNAVLAMAGERGWLTREVIACVWSYVWDQCELPRVTALVREDRVNALRINVRLGFKVEGLLRRFEQGHNVIVLGMLREECRSWEAR
jgi:hypothetical protein